MRGDGNVLQSIGNTAKTGRNSHSTSLSTVSNTVNYIVQQPLDYQT